MPPLPVIPDVFRISMIFTAVDGVRPVNVFHLFTASSDVELMGEEIETAVTGSSNNPFSCLQSEYICDYIDILPLDGISTTYRHDAGVAIVGGAPGEIVPSSAGVLSMKTNQRGPRGRGRLYIGPVGESSLEAGLINTADRAEAVAGWGEVKTALAGSGVLADIVVASYTHSDFNLVNAFSMRAPAGTQRRRQNQLV